MENDSLPPLSEGLFLKERIAELERQLADAQATISLLSAPHDNSSARRFELLFAHSRDMILFVRQRDGAILDANPAALKAYGYSRLKMLALNIRDLRSIESNDLTGEQLALAATQGLTFETRHRRKTGAAFPVEVSSQGAVLNDELILVSVIRDITDRKQAEAERARLMEEFQREKTEAQRRAEELNAIIETLHDPVLVYDRGGLISRANAAAVRAHGFDPSRQHRSDTNRSLVVRTPDGAVIDSDGLPSARALKGDTIIGELVEITNAFGQLSTVEISSSPLLIDGQQIGAVSVWHDITLQVQAEKAGQEALASAQESQRLLETILENVPVGLAITGGPPDFPVLRVSRHGLEMNSRPAADLIGVPTDQHQYAWNFFLPDGVTRPTPEQMPLYRASRLGRPTRNMEMVMLADDGRRIFILVNASPVRDEQGRILAAVNSWVDISDQKRTEQALRESRDRANWLARLPGENPNPVARVSADGRVLYHNSASARTDGWKFTNDQMLPEPMLALLQQAMSGVNEVRRELKLDGSYFEVVAMPFPLEGYANLYGRNITEFKQNELELAEYAERLKLSNQELEQFAFVASHDLQEPLRKIIRFGQSIRERLKPGLSEAETGEAAGLLARVENAAERMQAMIDGLLELSRISTQGRKFERVDLNRIAGEVLSDLEIRIQQAKGQVRIGSLPTLEADPLQMRQLLQNLIANGLKFHLPGRPPIVHVRGETPEARAGKRSCARIQVQDEGIGFDESEADFIFQPFRRLRGREEFEGTGMGLAICQRIVDRHRGKISVHSQPDQGSTFTIELPFKQPG